MKGDAQRELEMTADAQRLVVLVHIAELHGRLLQVVRGELLCPFCGALAGASHVGDCIVLEVEALVVKVDAAIDAPPADPEVEVRWFGDPWPTAPEGEERTPVPIGEACARCRVTISESDQGVLIPTFGGSAEPYHLACILRAVGVGTLPEAGRA
jgi:hypothetical protein